MLFLGRDRFDWVFDTSGTGHEVNNRINLNEGFLVPVVNSDLSSTASDGGHLRQLKFSHFGGCIRGQEKSWSNEEEGSQEEGC